MDIRNEKIFLVKGGDIPVSQIAKFFIPHEMDEGFAKLFLRESIAISCGGVIVVEETTEVKEIVAVCTVSKGETLEEMSEEMRRKGWRFATLGDWYRYHTNYPFPEEEDIAILGTTHLDEDYREWALFVSPWKDASLFQKITKRESKIIAKVLLKIKWTKVVFQSRKQFLVSRIVEEEKVPQQKKPEGPS